MGDEKDTPLDFGSSDDEEIEIEFVDVESGLMPVDESSEAVEEEGETDSVQEEITRLKNELDHVHDIYLRKLAEFDNFRKRTEREREEFRQSATEGVVREMLPVLDNFERALLHEEADGESFRQGVEMIAKQLKDILERQGVEEVNPIGQSFDPEYHEAVQRVETHQYRPGEIAWVMIKGYTFGGRLIRPAMVGVAVAPDSGGSVSEGVEGSGGGGST